jgi:outer membrane lipoprotein
VMDPMNMALRSASSVVAVFLVSACSSPNVIPPSLTSQVDRHVDFPALKHDAASYKGRLVLVGGEVLMVKRFKDQTQITVLQLPLDTASDPISDRTNSQGRFLAIQEEFLDPAVLPPMSRVTLVGEVTGSKTLPLDEVEYEYPVLLIRSLTVWPPVPVRESWSPFGYPWRPTYALPYVPSFKR